MSDDERKISFDTGINLDGLDNDTKELKSMANDIARTIENMGKDIEDNVSGINMDSIQSSMQDLTAEAIKSAQAMLKVNQMINKLDDVTGPKAILDSIKEYEKELEKLQERMAGYSQFDIDGQSESYKQDKESVEELRNSINAAKDDLRNYYMQQEAEKIAIDNLKQVVKEKAAAEKKAAREAAEAVKQSAKEKALAEKQAAEEEKQAQEEVAAAQEKSIARKKKLGSVCKMLGSQIGKVAGKAIGMGGAMSKADSRTQKISGSLKKLAGIAKTALVFNVIRKGLDALREQFGTMLKANDEFSSSLAVVKGNLAVAFQPIYEAAMPYINMLMQGLKTLTNQLAVFTNTLFGKTISASTQAAKAMNKQAAAAKKVGKETQKAVANIDEFNILSDNSSSSDSGTAIKYDVTESTGASDFANMLKQAWENQDFTDVGVLIGQKITNMLQGINWDEVYSNASRVAISFATFFNGLADGIDWNVIGQTVSGGINTALIFADTFLTNFNFLGFGEKIGSGLTSAISTIQWDLLGRSLADILNGAFDWIYGFLSTFDWTLLGSSLASSISNFFNTTNWRELGVDVSALVIGVVDMLTELLRDTDWLGVVNAVFDVIKGIDWGGVIRSLIELIVTVFLTLLTLIYDVGINIGEMLIEGLKDGIVSLIKNIGLWLYNNLVKPIIDAVCNFFGIHSPSTVFSDIGQFLIKGLLNGVSGMLGSVRQGFNKLVDTIIAPFRNLGETLKSIFSNAWQRVLNIFSATSFAGVASNIGATFKNIINRLISGINNVVSKPFQTLGSAFATLRKVNILGGHPFGFLPNIQAPQIPFLAKGAVIPANSPFVAVLGDQRSGNNIEAPERLIRQIMRDELAGLTDRQRTEVVVSLKGEMAKFFQAFVEEYKKERDKTGKDPILGI